MSNVCEMIKPDQFEVSMCNRKYSEVIALYHLTKQGMPLTKKNIKKHSVKMFQEKIEELKNPLCPIVSVTTVILKCSVTKKELGYYVKQNYLHWNILSIVFVKEEFRGLGLSKKLISHFEGNSNGLTLIELNKNDFEETKNIYQKWGYIETVNGFFNHSVALIKKGTMEDLGDAYNKSNDMLLKQQQERFVRAHNKAMKILNNCEHISEVFEKRKKLSTVFKDVRWDLDSFLEYELKTNSEQSPWYEFVKGFCDVNKQAA